MVKICKKCGIKVGQNNVTCLCHRCYQKQWRETNKKHIKEYNDKWSKEHKEERRTYNSKWSKENKEKRKISRQKTYANMKNDPIKYLKDKIRRHIRKSVKYRTKYSLCKDKTTEDILGCSIDEFIRYIENRFSYGMTWDNYGKWHLDHIIPLSSARTKEEVYKLCHYTNYQPLWAKDNLRKSNKMT